MERMDVPQLSPQGQVLWICGIASSVMCLSIQVFLYILLPSSRKLDQMILTHLTIARLGNVVDNYILVSLQITDPMKLCAHITLGLNLLTESAITMWMFIFTKNLYDKVIQVFSLKDTNFVLLSVCVWLVTVPFGIVCPVFLSVDIHYCNIFYCTFVSVKFIVHFINFFLFCRIFWVIATLKTDRNLKSLLKTSIVSLMLLLTTSLQAMVEVMFVDVTSYFLVLIKYGDLGYSFKVINSYQVIAITAIFVVLSRDPQHDSVQKTLALRLKKMMV